MKSLEDLFNEIDGVPSLPYGSFTPDEKKLLEVIKKRICDNDQEKMNLLEELIMCYLENAKNESAFDASGESQ